LEKVTGKNWIIDNLEEVYISRLIYKQYFWRN